MIDLPFFLGGLYLGAVIAWVAMTHRAITREGRLIDKLQSTRDEVARLNLLLRLNGYVESAPKDGAGGGV